MKQSAAVALAPKAAKPDLRYFRIAAPDITKHGDWLLWRLRDRYPHLTDANLMGWLRGQTESNEVKFVGYGRAWGMASIGHKPLDPRPIVNEVFVFIQPRDDGVIDKDAMPEGIAIYAEFKRWAESLGAAEITFDYNTDVPREMVKGVLGRVSIREVSFVKLGK